MASKTGSPAQSEPIIFGAYAMVLRQAGLAVLPALGKRPIRSGFAKWQHAPGIAAVEKWAQTNPTNNIVYIPGLSRTRNHPNGLVIVDADNAAEVARAEELFGRTPAMIDTRRGRHFVYRADEKSLGKIGSLRKAGFEIDIKHGQNGSGVSVAPPSRHPEQEDFAYRWHPGSCLEALTDLPLFNSKVLDDLIGGESKTLPNATETAPGAFRGSAKTLGRAIPDHFREGSRKLGLNDHLCAHSGFIEDFDACLDIAETWNDDLQDRWGKEKLPDEEVVEVCRSVMTSIVEGRLVRTLGKRATALTDADEVRFLTATCQNGDAAFTLLMLFRAEHTARCLRGETFAICIKAMVEAHTLGEWSARRYREARDALLNAQLIERVSDACGHIPAQYRLTDRALTPSVESRTSVDNILSCNFNNYTELAVRFKAQHQK